jgi:hypothetical protein
MPTSKKPRKAYRPPAARPSANHIKTFRFNADSELWLSMQPHQALEALRQGRASTDDHNTLVIRVLWAVQMARDHFNSEPSDRADLDLAVAAIGSVSERYDRLGQFGASGPELTALGIGLTLADHMQEHATRRQQEQSLATVLGRNEKGLKSLQKKVVTAR